jgi:nitrate reductase NapD
MNEELHIAGIVVQVHPEGARQAAATIAALPGAEVHATSRDGKLVVTLEASSAREIAARMEDIRHFDAVLSAALVYQHNEALAALMQEIPHEAHPT